MPISYKGSVLIWAGLAVKCLLFAAAAQAEDVSFMAHVDFGAGTYPYSIAVGDFNGDLVLDLAVANNGSNNVSVFLGNGDGTFQATQSFSAGSGPLSVAVGDFNGDLVLDLAVANGYSNNVSVLLGNGDGTFQTAVNYFSGSAHLSFVIGSAFSNERAEISAVAN